ncbi:hypothetical protein DM02DRAFT_26320 [Periconia macrospinosa]|uniref:Uncharacterized protein n=1 Tax=Periconia macrospinosa TaxID=97972 RepID=A0A2V1DKX5_9PLEO|nr:hypothetical protein DM02DRAFT_26320 [Periconia macrospinosa]
MESTAPAHRGPAHDVPHTGHSPVSPKTSVVPLQSASEPASAPAPASMQPPFPPGSIGACCMEFIQRINITFGEHSQQRATILQALRSFKIGELSKRNAHMKMSQVLNTHPDLQNHLLEILDHPDARWGPGDFVFPQTLETPPTGGTTQTLPEYMEPQHRPQFPLPYTSPEWIATPQSGLPQPTSPLGNPSDLPYIPMPQLNTCDALQVPRHEQNNGYDAYNRYENSPHPQTAYIPNENTHWDSFTSSGLSFPLPSMSNVFNQPTEFSSPNCDDAGRFSNNTWPANGVETLPADAYHRQSEPFSTPMQSRVELNTTSHVHEVPESFSTYHRADNTTALAPINQSADNGQNNGDLGVSVDNGLNQIRQCTDWTAINHSVDPQEESAVQRCSPKSSSVPSPCLPQQDKVNRFIHGICGQAFRTRFGVKKHHWGTNVDDVNTTSGCWNKHGKPDRAWNEHPSCAYDDPKPRAKSRTKNSETKAPVVPSMVPSSDRLLPDFPILKDLPGTVAGLVNGAPAFSECSESYELPRLASRDQKGMESLLSAVNVVSHPVRGRNDSLSLISESKASPTMGNGQAEYPSWLDTDDRHYPWPGSLLRSQQLTDEQMRCVGMHTAQAENDGYPSPPMMLESTGASVSRKRGRSIKKEKENMAGLYTVAEPNEKKMKI